METIDSSKLDTKFKNEVAACAGGENLKYCYACGTCTAGCPVAEIDDEFDPRKIIRQVVLGMKKEVLSSPVIWRCVQCYSCTAKCPQNVRFREIIRALREMAVKEGYVTQATHDEVEELGRFSQALRRDLVEKLFKDKKGYEKAKSDLRAVLE